MLIDLLGHIEKQAPQRAQAAGVAAAQELRPSQPGLNRGQLHDAETVTAPVVGLDPEL